MTEPTNQTPETNHQPSHERHHPKPKYEAAITIVILIGLCFFSQFIFDGDDNNATKKVSNKKSHSPNIKKTKVDTIIYINHIGFKDTFIKEGNKVYNHGILINSKIRYEQ
jgi:hypothetical protein